MVEQPPQLSIVLPAYNEEKRLPPTLHRIALHLAQQSYCSEVLVVENGSTDCTTEVVQSFIESYAHPGGPISFHLLHSEQGKGRAVKTGVLASRGEYIIISDTDLAVPIEEVDKFLPPAIDPAAFAVAIASREVEGAVRHGEPSYRHLMGRVFNALVRALAVPEIHDTQCGFKCFTRSAAQTIFPLQRIDGWGFDVEVLYIAQRHGLSIIEIPVDWYFGSDSRVRPVQDTVNMVRELMLIRRNGRRGYYDFPSGSETVDEFSTT